MHVFTFRVDAKGTVHAVVTLVCRSPALPRLAKAQPSPRPSLITRKVDLSRMTFHHVSCHHARQS
jgi:hypothetical protein